MSCNEINAVFFIAHFKYIYNDDEMHEYILLSSSLQISTNVEYRGGMHLLNSEAKRYIRSLDFKKELKDLVEEQGFVYSE